MQPGIILTAINFYPFVFLNNKKTFQSKTEPTFQLVQSRGCVWAVGRWGGSKGHCEMNKFGLPNRQTWLKILPSHNFLVGGKNWILNCTQHSNYDHMDTAILHRIHSVQQW